MSAAYFILIPAWVIWSCWLAWRLWHGVRLMRRGEYWAVIDNNLTIAAVNSGVAVVNVLVLVVFYLIGMLR